MRCERSSPNVTTNPETIPIRLITTCTRVKTARPVAIVYTPPFRLRFLMMRRGDKIHACWVFVQRRLAATLLNGNYLYHRIAVEHLSTKANPGLSLSSKVTLACGGFHVHSTRKTTGEIEADPRRGGCASTPGLRFREYFGF